MVGAFSSAFPCGETEALKLSGCCKSASVIHVVLQGLGFEPGRRERAAVLTGEGGVDTGPPPCPIPCTLTFYPSPAFRCFPSPFFCYFSQVCRQADTFLKDFLKVYFSVHLKFQVDRPLAYKHVSV